MTNDLLFLENDSQPTIVSIADSFDTIDARQIQAQLYPWLDRSDASSLIFVRNGIAGEVLPTVVRKLSKCRADLIIADTKSAAICGATRAAWRNAAELGNEGSLESLLGRFILLSKQYREIMVIEFDISEVKSWVR